MSISAISVGIAAGSSLVTTRLQSPGDDLRGDGCVRVVTVFIILSVLSWTKSPPREIHL